MPTDSCVDHPRGRFICLRQSYIDMFDGDHCAAALAAYFEYSTTCELARMRSSGETGEPWFKASTPAISEEVLGLYSIRTIQDRIDKLLALKIIQSEGVPGKVRRFLFDYEGVSDHLTVRKVFRLDSVSPKDVLDPGKIADGFAAVLPSCDDALSPKVLNRSKSYVSTPTPTDSLTLENFRKVFFSRYKQAKGSKLDSQKGDRRVTTDWLANRSDTQDEILAALDCFLQDGHWAAQGFPLAAFRKQFEKYLDLARGDSATAETNQDALVSTPSPVTAPSAPSTPPAPRIDPLAVWNSTALAKPCIDWSPRREQHLIDRAMDDPEFEERLSQVCSRAQKILTVRPDCDWLTFRWILGSKNRRMNWWRLLTEMEWMEKPEMSRSGQFGNQEESRKAGERAQAMIKERFKKQRELEDAED